jgi:hypothetical protein
MSTVHQASHEKRPRTLPEYLKREIVFHTGGVHIQSLPRPKRTKTLVGRQTR